MKFSHDLKKFLPVNLSRIFLALALAFFSYQKEIMILFNYSIITIIISASWLIIFHYQIVDSINYPKIEFFPTLIDVFIISFMVICTGGPNSFTISAYFYMTAVCSLNTKIKQGLFSVYASIISLLTISILMYFDLLPNTTVTGHVFEKNILIFGISNAINIIFNISIYFTIHSLIKKNEELFENSILEKEKSDKANKLKNEILANMSHEIRTPMNAIIGMTNHMLEEEENESTLDSLKIVKFSADQLLVIINDILDLSKIEADKIEFEKIDFSLKSLIENIIKLNLNKAKDKNISLEFQVDESVPKYLIGDPTRLAQILNNLISNSIKFTEKGKVLIQVIQLKQTNEFSSIHFLVRDTGIGIPNDKLSFIFEKFNQASTETTRKFGGTGLGLSIVKKLIQMMGSDIGVKSEIGIGSEFYFQLNFLISEKDETFPKINSLNSVEKNLKQIKILLVDDNELNIKIAKKFLEKWNAKIETASNGKEAVETYLQRKDFFDLILMDLQMPIMDGYEATKLILKQQINSKKIPILALTADAMQETKDRITEIGFQDLLTKPFKPDELYEKISAFNQDQLNQNPSRLF